MDKAKKQAEQIPEDKRAEEIHANLTKAAENMRTSSKEQTVKVKEAELAMNKAVEDAKPDHQQQVQETVVMAKKLLAQLKAGANVNDIVKKIKALK